MERNKQEILIKLEGVIRQRKAEMPEGSHTADLLREGLPEIIRKINEETGEVFKALLSEDSERVNSEVADVIYHLTVAMVAIDKGSWEGVLEKLDERRKESKQKTTEP